jgi:hypothetical protein
MVNTTKPGPFAYRLYSDDHHLRQLQLIDGQLLPCFRSRNRLTTFCSGLKIGNWVTCERPQILAAAHRSNAFWRRLSGFLPRCVVGALAGLER